MGLRETKPIMLVIRVWPVNDDFPTPHDTFEGYVGLPVAASFLFDPQCVGPDRGRSGVFGQLQLDLDVWVASGRETAELRDTSSFGHGKLEATTWFRYVPHEAKEVQEVRFPGGVSSRNEDTI